MQSLLTIAAHKKKRAERTRDIPVIFVTAKEGEKAKRIRMGASGYIVKPFKKDELKETIKSILARE